VNPSDFLRSTRLIIVAGKGGVGKTTVAGALAQLAARHGLRTLLVEVEGKGGLAHLFGAPPLGYETAELADGIEGRLITPDRALVEWLYDRGLRRLADRLTRTGALDVIATAAPGIRDILVLGKVKALVNAGAHDLIVLDTPASGHAVSFLRSARGLVDAVAVGQINQQSRDVIGMLSDASLCQVVLVTLPESTPVNELVETAYLLEDQVGVALGPVVANQVLEPLAAAASSERPAAADVLLDDAELAALQAALAHRAAREAGQAAELVRLAGALPLPQIVLPALAAHALGRADLDVLADALAVGIAGIEMPA
jgi:anion-transporting  ArsA/GET3 family ATPase